jgi:hypothetical protein
MLIGWVSGIDMCSDVTVSSKLYFMACVPMRPNRDMAAEAVGAAAAAQRVESRVSVCSVV